MMTLQEFKNEYSKYSNDEGYYDGVPPFILGMTSEERQHILKLLYELYESNNQQSD